MACHWAYVMCSVVIICIILRSISTNTQGLNAGSTVDFHIFQAEQTKYLVHFEAGEGQTLLSSLTSPLVLIGALFFFFNP